MAGQYLDSGFEIASLRLINRYVKGRLQTNIRVEGFAEAARIMGAVTSFAGA